MAYPAHVACCYSVVSAAGHSDYSTKPQAAGELFGGADQSPRREAQRVPSEIGRSRPVVRTAVDKANADRAILWNLVLPTVKR